MSRRTLRHAISSLAPRALGVAALLHCAALDAVPTLLVCDSSQDRVVRLEDVDGSGRIELDSSGEVIVFYDDASPGPDLSTPSALARGPANELYLLDGGTLDQVLRLADSNGDADANDDGEVLVFFEGGGGRPELGTPNSLALAPDGTLYLADDGGGRGLVLALRDDDGDGDAMDDGEWRVIWDSEAVAAEPPLEFLTDPEALAVATDGTLLVADAASEKLFRLRDLDGDGSAMGEGELVVFYRAAGAHPFADPEGLSVSEDGAVWAADEDTGTILRLVDLDADGVALSPGESVIFVDDRAPTAPRDTNDITVTASALWALDGERDQIWRLADIDGDGLALSDGEVTGLLVPSERVVGTPSGLVVLGDEAPQRLSLVLVDPAHGPVGGGNAVGIEGTFPKKSVARVFFGGAEASVLAASPTRLECVAPAAGAPGVVDVVVRVGEEEATLAAAYRYEVVDAEFVRGDANEDGTINVSDAIVILGYLFLGRAAPPCLDAADVNDDGELAIPDPIGVLGHLFLGGAPPAPPFPGSGTDPTDDELDCARSAVE